ncbi:MAG: META domain-containing protein [Tsuneonella sp.]
MRVALVLAVLLAATGCVAKSSAPNALQGEWRFVEIDGAPAAVPAKAKLTVEPDRLSASAGCNGMGGPWRIEEDRLIAGPLAGTRMYCTGPVWNQEQALSALLVAAPTIAYKDEQLVLKSSGHSAALERIGSRR